MPEASRANRRALRIPSKFGVALGGAALVVFEVGDALVEGEGLLDQFEALAKVLVTDSVDFIHGVEASTNFAQFRRQKILQNLTDIFDNAHGNHHA